jgi:hypothetical protein
MSYRYSQASDKYLQQVLELQKANLKENLPDEEIDKEGFVTASHTYDELKIMNDLYPHTIVTFNDQVVGYALSMVPQFRNLIPILVPMFEMIDEEMARQNRNDSFIIMGQVCIAKGHRGKGLFQGLYDAMQKRLSSLFDVNITEVAVNNLRSMRAHEKVGYKIMKVYTDRFGVEWALIEWRWS